MASVSVAISSITDRLLLVDGDIVCFPKSIMNTNSHSLEALKYEVVSQPPKQSSQLINSVTDIIRIQEAPILAFFDHIFDRSSLRDNTNKLNLRKRIARWIRGDLSQQGVQRKSDNQTEKVNSQSLNYSAYSMLYHNHYLLCTVISWVIALVLFCLRITSIHFSTFRMLFITVFVCPFAVSILETLFQSLYLFYTIGHWKYMKVASL